MNARESLAADREAQEAHRYAASLELPELATMEACTEYLGAYLAAIAAEMRAARVYANYLEGREGSRSSDKRLAKVRGL